MGIGRRENKKKKEKTNTHQPIVYSTLLCIYVGQLFFHACIVVSCHVCQQRHRIRTSGRPVDLRECGREERTGKEHIGAHR